MSIGLLGKSEGSFSLPLHYEIDAQWAAIVTRGPISQADLGNITAPRSGFC